MNREQVISLLRTIMQICGGIAVTRGWADEETVTTLLGAIITIIPTVWALYDRRNAGLVQSAAALPQVAQIVTTSPHIADAAGPKVTTAS